MGIHVEKREQTEVTVELMEEVHWELGDGVDRQHACILLCSAVHHIIQIQ